MDKGLMVFNELCRAIDSDVFLRYPDAGETIIELAVNDFLLSLGIREQTYLADFLKDKLSNLNAEDLDYLWLECGSQFVFYDGAIVDFFQYIIETITL